MSRKKKIAIAIAVVLLLLLLLLAWFAFAPKAGAPKISDPGAELQKTQPGGLASSGDAYVAPQDSAEVPTASGDVGNEVPAPPAEPDGSANIRRLAMAFAERFGSFSNQGDYQNIEDLRVFMSDRMKGWADAYVQNARDNAPASGTEEYSGITTRALSSELDAYSEEQGSATVTVSTQRTERTGLAQTQNVRYQTIRIEFVMENGTWKVDGAFWNEEGNGS